MLIKNNRYIILIINKQYKQVTNKKEAIKLLKNNKLYISIRGNCFQKTTLTYNAINIETILYRNFSKCLNRKYYYKKNKVNNNLY